MSEDKVVLSAQTSFLQGFGAAGGIICSFAEPVHHQSPSQGCVAGGSAGPGSVGCTGWGQTTSNHGSHLNHGWSRHRHELSQC